MGEDNTWDGGKKKVYVLMFVLTSIFIVRKYSICRIPRYCSININIHSRQIQHLSYTTLLRSAAVHGKTRTPHACARGSPIPSYKRRTYVQMTNGAWNKLLRQQWCRTWDRYYIPYMHVHVLQQRTVNTRRLLVYAATNLGWLVLLIWRWR